MGEAATHLQSMLTVKRHELCARAQSLLIFSKELT